MNKQLDRTAPDLWTLAIERTITPKGVDLGSRGARRTARTQRRRIWMWFGISAALTIVFCGLTVALSDSLVAPLLTTGALLGLATTSALGVFQVRASAYRRLTVRMKRGATPAWWTFTLLAWLFAVPAAMMAVVTVVAPQSLPSADELLSLKHLAAMTGLVGVLLSMMSSAATPPMLSASPKPLFYQAHWSQITWTVAMLAITICVMAYFFNLGQPSWITELDCTLGLALITALLAWHARALHNLRAVRKLLIERLTLALEATSNRECDTSGAVSALLALRSAMLENPFRSQSPASPPPGTGWEMAQIVAILLHAYAYSPMPESVTGRVHLPDDLARPFVHVVDASPETLRDSVRPFLVCCIEWMEGQGHATIAQWPMDEPRARGAHPTANDYVKVATFVNS